MRSQMIQKADGCALCEQPSKISVKGQVLLDCENGTYRKVLYKGRLEGPSGPRRDCRIELATLAPHSIQ
jgi:hypothetical protein